MARRLTAEEKQRLLEQDFWARYNAEREAIVASGAGREVTDLEQSIWETSQRPDFSNVTTSSPFREQAYISAQDRPQQAGLLGDLVIDAAASGADIGANLIDMAMPDANALARDTSNPFQNALQNVIDTGLRVPTIIDDAVRGAVSRLAPNASPEAVDAVMRTVNPYAAGARDIVKQREAEAAERIASGVDMQRTGWFNETADSVRNVADTMRSRRTPETQEAVQGLGEAVDSGVVDTAKFLASGQGVRALSSVTAGSSPWAALGFGAGALGAAAGLTPAAATAGAGATMFSALATSNATQAENAILGLSEPEALQSPVITDLMSRGMDVEQAKRAAASQARFATVAAMVPTAPLYAMGTFERMGAGMGHREAVLQTLRGRVVSGTGREMAQEFPQEGGERYASNVGEIAAGTRSEEDRYEGVAGSGLLGAAAAGPLASAASYTEARGDFDNRAAELNAIADRLEQAALRRAQQREELEQAAFEEQAMERLAAQEAQRAFIGAAPMPATDGIDNAGRPVESFEQYAAREGAEVIASEEAQRQFLAQNTLESSNAALQNSLREGPRGAVSTELTGTRASRRAENERLAASAAADQAAFQQEELAQAQFEEETMSRLNGERPSPTVQAEAVAEAAVAEAEGSVSVAQARGVLNRVKGQQKAKETKAVNRRLAAIAKANPSITAEELARAANTGVVPAAAAPVSRDDLLAAGMTEAEADAELAQAASTAAATATTADREAALRARLGRADATTAPKGGRSAADVVRELAGRVRKGNSSEALAQEQLLKSNKLSIVDGDQMAALAPDAPNARGYYDGKKMYINASRIPEGNASGAVLQEILAHEADHAARLSNNTDVKSRVRTLLGDTATAKLLNELRTSNHRDAVAARDFVAQVGIDENTDPLRYEDELTAYAITSAVRNKDTGVWAPIRGVMSAARRKFKQYTDSDNINLDDLAGYAQDVINALATSDQDISAQGSPADAGVDFTGEAIEASRGSALPPEEVFDDGLLSPWLMADGTVVQTNGDHISAFSRDSDRNYGDFMRRTGAVRMASFRDADSGNVMMLHTYPGQSFTAQQIAALSTIRDVNGDFTLMHGEQDRTNPEYSPATIETLPTREGASAFDGRHQIAYHGTPTTFAAEEGAPLGRFRSSQARTGEGAQVYGAGHYLTQQHGTADKRYRERLVGSAADPVWNTAKLVLDDANGDIEAARATMTTTVADFPSLQPVLDVLNNNDAQRIQDEVEQQSTLDRGEVYYADIPEDNELAHWQHPIETLDPKVIQGIKNATAELAANGRIHSLDQSAEVNVRQPFFAWYTRMAGRFLENAQEVSQTLAKHGVKGHIFFGTTDGPRNFVIYSDDDVQVVGRDRREAGEDRASMLQWAQEWRDSRPATGWADDSADATPVTKAPYVRSAARKATTLAKNLFMSRGAAGKEAFLLREEAEQARDAVYATAVSHNGRIMGGIARAAARIAASKGTTVKEESKNLNDMLASRLEAISKVPSQSRRDSLIARMVQEYPELAPVQEAINDINALTHNIVDTRMKDPAPMSEDEVKLYEYLLDNKSAYFTNVYALFQGKTGDEYADRILKGAAAGYKALAEGKQIPANVRDEFRVYDNALKFIIANDIAVKDPVMLDALSTEDLSNLYDLWAPRGDSAANLRVRMENEGGFDLESYRGHMADFVAGRVAQADPSTIESMGHSAVKALLQIQDLTGPAKRYMRGMTIDDTILQHRQPLPKEIQDLYGKIRDVPTLIASTLTRQGELSSRTDFLLRLMNATHSDGRPMVVAKSEAALPGLEDYTVELSAESFGPVKGMMTTPELGQMLTDYSEMFMTLTDALDIVGYKPSVMNSLAATTAGKLVQGQAGLQKRMSILTRPDYMLMNLAGSVVSPVLVGGVSPEHLWRGMKVAVQSVLNTVDPEGKVHDPSIDGDMRLALEMGLLDNPVTQEIRNLPRAQLRNIIRNMNEAGGVEEFMHGLRDGTEEMRKVWQAWVEVYSMSDAWVKLPIALQRMDFLRSYYNANGDEVTNEQVMREAADFTKNSTLSLSRVPPLLKGLERAGVTRFGPYIASVFRTLGYVPFNIWKTVNMAVDAKTPEARNIAALMAGRQTAGMLSVGVLTTHGLRMLADAMMDDDEREQMERDRKFMFDNDSFADLIYMGTNEKGDRMYFNLSRLDQFGPAFDIARALQRQGSVEEKMEVLQKSLVDTMIWSASIPALIKAGYDMLPGTDVKDKGTRLERIAPAQSQMFKDFVDGLPKLDYSDANSLLELVDKFLPAGPVNIIDPATPHVEDPVGLSESVFSAALTSLGHKFVTVSQEASLAGAAKEYGDYRALASKRIKDNLDTRGPQAALDTLVDQAVRERELVRRLGGMYKAAVESGQSPREVMRSLKDAGLDARTISNVANGAYESENVDWAKKYSSLLSSQLTRNAPRKYWQSDEQEEQDAEVWREQAEEVRRRLSIMGYEENE